MDFKFGADKKLKSRKRIERLFLEGKRATEYPLVAVYLMNPVSETGFKIGVSVPKRKFKKAVDRNLIKRRIREAFRLNQHKLKTKENPEVMFIYTSSKILDFERIEKSILSLIDFLNSVSTDETST